MNKASKVIFALLVAVVLLTPLIAFPKRGSAWVSPQEIFAALAFWPCAIISLIGFGFGLITIFKGKGNLISGICILALSLILPGAFAFKSIEFQSNYDASYAWFDLVGGSGRINFHLHDYIIQNPDSISYPDPSSEEVHVNGFWEHMLDKGPFIMNDHSGRKHDMIIRQGFLHTPWGARIRIAVDRNEDGYIEADGQKSSTNYGFADPRTNNPDYEPGLATAVFITLPDDVLSGSKSSMVTLDTPTYERLKGSIRY